MFTSSPIPDGCQSDPGTDAEAHAWRRARKVAERSGFAITRQPDPRGCPLYIWHPISGSPDPWGGLGVSG